ncbi:MAG: cytochrome C oxidase subunit IV family protein [Anaerolineales bacterium]|nr:cytochrome C oxidase subunit IV family protein [Anaerolineales bacterium]
MNGNNNEKLKEVYRSGVVVIILLAILTIGEFFIGAIAVGWAAPLWIIAILKAWLVLRDYMHLPRLFSESEE